MKKVIFILKVKAWKIYSFMVNYYKYLILKRRIFKSKPNKLIRNNTHNQEIIVSVTSFGDRLKFLYLPIISILQQTRRPNRIICYFGSDVTMQMLPTSLTNLQEFGVEFEFRNGNLKPHKKYYYAMKENPNSIIITIDDDCIYPSDMINNLLDTYYEYSDCIIANRVHRMRFSTDGKLLPYNNWEWESNYDKPSMELIATGDAGVLYPPCILDKYIGGERDIIELALNADDIWLKSCEIKANIKVKLANISTWHNTAEIPGTQIISLGKNNVGCSQNDIFLTNCINFFNIDINSIREK